MSELFVSPGLSVKIAQPDDFYAKASLSPFPASPDLPFIRLALTGKSHGGAEYEQYVQLEVDAYGVVTVRVHETQFIKALVVNGAGQQYPAP